MKKVVLVEPFSKQKANIRKNYSTMQKVKSKINTNLTKNENISNKSVSNMDEAILRWDKLMSEIKVSSNDQDVDTTEHTGDAPIYLEKLQKSIENDGKSKILPIKTTQHIKMKVNSLKTDTNKQIHSKINMYNNLKPDVNNRCSRNVNLSNANDLEPLKAEMEKMNNYMEQLNNKLKTVTVEFFNEKSSNSELMKSVTAALDKFQNIELEQKTREEFCYKEKLDLCTKELENIKIEKNDLLKRYLDESEVKLDDANKKILTLLEKIDYSEEKMKEIEDERVEWKSFEIHLDHQISENQKALDRKEQYIKNQDYLIENLTQEKLSLETQLKNPLYESKSNRSEEIENYQKKLRQLSTTMADKEKTLETTKELHNIEISEMRDRIKNLEKLIVTKNDVIHQQNMTLDLMREITPITNNNSIVAHRWS
ncbi:hypothetical protein AGLY_012315 [Aphis glycines]|uniref:Uncharacterized protein n=1 Tax=Aphis glycines TaxID=307491 RepID=A0A6G0T9R1_APHGL|nr:hypothetical protein AGLY_012315 [Aphis glycines]